ncbi:Methyltransferase FkbM [Ruegeria sp. TM1040]|uniref:FkbM family methyltransferase n=1 Tax=Ruegeria sp. (strain TM1040) TaxID=292414 RepID=UPI00005558E0|nr:FkbM family methyltransferase [Ruegeria sp. TM1040]ABF63977.1 Methyltransferase FkbM [Ruegeria sp. TM1040]MDF9302744.1 FkbM family methyltransferase [Tritonibacter mobilis]
MLFDPSKLPDIVARISSGQSVGFADVSLYTSEIHGRRMVFSVDMQRDPIQRSHREGHFYEEEELSVIKSLFPLGGTFVDIGANVGNHGLYAAAFLSAARVIPFEPNPKALKLLLANISANGLAPKYDLSHLGKGLGDAPRAGFGMEARDRNLGAAKMLAGEGDIEITTGDLALQDEQVDFIKIDVEGMEILVLSGLQDTIKRCRPALLVEVDRENDAAFHALIEQMGYGVFDTLQRYNRNKNYVIKPLQLDAES